MRRQHVRLPYTIEGWIPATSRQKAEGSRQYALGRVGRCLLTAAYCVVWVLAGMGLAWLLTVLHRAGLP